MTCTMLFTTHQHDANGTATWEEEEEEEEEAERMGCDVHLTKATCSNKSAARVTPPAIFNE
jgi:hypothetical protein